MSDMCKNCWHCIAEQIRDDHNYPMLKVYCELGHHLRTKCDDYLDYDEVEGNEV